MRKNKFRILKFIIINLCIILYMLFVGKTCNATEINNTNTLNIINKIDLIYKNIIDMSLKRN